MKTFSRRIALAVAALALTTAWLAAAAQAAPEVTMLEAGLSSYQAGGHPESTLKLELATEPAPGPAGGPTGCLVKPCTVVKGGAARDIITDLPKGIYANAQNAERCTYKQMFEGNTEGTCPPGAQVGTLKLRYISAGSASATLSRYAIYQMVPARGQVASFATSASGVFVAMSVKLRADGEYALRVEAKNIYDGWVPIYIEATFWGVPQDPSHNADRRGPKELSPGIFGFGFPSGPTGPRVPFMVAPAECGVDGVTTVSIRSWIDPADWATHQSAPQQVTGCNQVDFKPTLEARPTTNVADAPTGLDFKLHIPQNDEDPDGLATAPLRDAVVTLPRGMTVNAASAAGLAACSMEEVGISPAGAPNGNPVTCPDAAKIGTATAFSPPLREAVTGSVYLARQKDNPFGSLLALYLVLENEERGVRVKLPGEVKADPQSGQLTTIFRNNPQLPVEDIELHLKQGPRAPLKTPLTCGTFATTSTLTPWTAPEGAAATPADSFAVSKGPGGGACLGSEGEAPNRPAFSAGTTSPAAAAYAPFVMRLARADGTQRIGAIDTTLPKGLLGKLAGVPYCPDAALAAASGRSGTEEQASPSCPSASQVGSVDVGAGAGSAPLHVGGKAYLAGPYKGAPLSLAIVTPAVAGPFDLGTVVVRAALRVDPETAQIRAVSDPIPSILQGIPLDVRSIALRVDRPQFTLNPTSCEPMSVTGSAFSLLGRDADLSSPFQVSDCAELGFKPRLRLRLKGGIKRGDYPALRAEVRAKPGQANIGRVSVALPHSEFLAQEHIRTICTRVQYAADRCPAGSVYGRARAITPLLDQPLEGPVYLRSSNNPLPDLVIALKGQIEVDLVGRIDSVNGGIRNTFETVPDAPVSRFVLEMQGGKKGLLVNSRDICKSVHRATARIDGQNGRTADQRPVLRADCKKPRQGQKRGMGR